MTSLSLLHTYRLMPSSLSGERDNYRLTSHHLGFSSTCTTQTLCSNSLCFVQKIIQMKKYVTFLMHL